jgi:hypothetical protein
MTTATVTNNQPKRKQLSDQLDRLDGTLERLDGILDALSEGLNGAVADAAREGTRLAVKDAIVEIMTDATLRVRLHDATAAEPAAEPTQPTTKLGFWAHMKAKASQAVAAVGGTASKVVDGAARRVQRVTDAVAEGVRTIQGLGSLRKLALVGVGVGVAVGIASFLAPHAVAAAVSGISGAVAAAVVQVGAWTRRTFRTLSMA